jgi:uncharacterized protein (TIGR02996 family)
MGEAEAFEHAIRENPDDVASYSAYADWLQEHDDPRGEFIAVQLALEDESRSLANRKALKKREVELLNSHEREWLGELEPLLFDGLEEPIQHRWRRGFLAELDCHYLPGQYVRVIATAPAVRLLRELRVRSGEGLSGLVGAPCLESLRVFRTGDDDDEPPEDGWVSSSRSHVAGLDDLLVAMPRVEEIHTLSYGINLRHVFSSGNLTNLRVLRMYHIGGRERNGVSPVYPLDVLAANPAFANLTQLRFHPHQPEGLWGTTGGSYIPLDQVRALVRSPHLKKLTHLQLRLSDMGDDGIREIIVSGILKRLAWLDLQHGCVTDEGARQLAACADAKRLERIDLSYNGVTATGLAALRSAGVNAVANNPLAQDQLDNREYLRHGDFE